MSESIEEKIKNYHPDLPKPFSYGLIRFALRLSLLPNKIKYFYDYQPGEFRKKQIILLADHAAYDSFVPVIAGWKESRLNTILTRKNCSTRVSLWLAERLGGIPKGNYRNDFKSLRETLNIIKKGGNILLFPEGMQSHCGSNQPINPGTLSFLKGAGLPVILCRSYGYHLLHPFFASEKRKGYAEFHFEPLFTPDELKEKDSETLYQKLLSRFRYNDYDWNEKQCRTYRTRKGNALGTERFLYRCPKCGQDSVMRSEGNDLFCSSCGNRIRLENDYRMIPTDDSVMPYRNPDEWYKDERKKVREEIESPAFSLEYDAESYYISSESKNLFNPDVPGGKGHIRIDAKGISYEGIFRDENAKLFFDIADTPSFYVNASGCNCLFDGKSYYSFKPLSDAVSPSKIKFIVEELHNRIDPVWNRVSRDAYDQ